MDLSPVPPCLLEEMPGTFEHGEFAYNATEEWTEPPGSAHAPLSIDPQTEVPDGSDRDINVYAAEDKSPVQARPEHAEEPAPIASSDMSDVEVVAGADQGAKEIAGALKQNVGETWEEPLPGDAIRIPASLHYRSDERSTGPAEDLGEAPGEPIMEAPEVEQNAFAANDAEKEEPRPKTTEAVDVQAQMGAIMERISDLRRFDVTTITQRFDPRTRELRDSVNNTISNVFGRNTPAYWHHSLPSFDAVPIGWPGWKPSPAQLGGLYMEEINKAIAKLTTIMESLKHGLPIGFL